MQSQLGQSPNGRPGTIQVFKQGISQDPTDFTDQPVANQGCVSPIKVLGIRKKQSTFNGKYLDKKRVNDDSFEDYYVDQDEEKIPLRGPEQPSVGSEG